MNDRLLKVIILFRDIVKLTAQFVARNGRQFLTNLMNREQRNYQFDFLRPQHSLFQYFTKLLEQYTKILIPPKDLMGRLKSESISGRESMNLVLDQVKYRANWQRHQEAQRRREEEKIEKERGECVYDGGKGLMEIVKIVFFFCFQWRTLQLIGTILLLWKLSITNRMRLETFRHQQIQMKLVLAFLWRLIY